ncbi:hypothetical protein JTB14_018797 [Gonioctena quinquepunctata]|nr:hypothetical protein JTB14_018797 [Gonioctena quinquepunctata]
MEIPSCNMTTKDCHTFRQSCVIFKRTAAVSVGCDQLVESWLTTNTPHRKATQKLLGRIYRLKLCAVAAP